MSPRSSTREQLIEEAQRLAARLSVLTLYDVERGALGYDFGNGQRYRELVRARRERDAAINRAQPFGYGVAGELDASPEQVRVAYREITRAKLARYQREAHTSRTYELAVIAWRRVADEIERTERA